MRQAIPIEDLKPIDETAIQILRIISLKLGEGGEGRIDYNHIALSIGKDRNLVASAVNRLVRRGYLKSSNGKLSIPIAVSVL